MGLREDLRNAGVMTGYSKYVMELEPVLQEMSNRGLPVSPERHAQVTAELTERLHEQELAMQALIPEAVRQCSPRKGYKREPKDTTGMTKRWFAYPGSEHIVPLEADCVKVERWVRLDE